MEKKSHMAPEEGDLNREAIKKGLTPEDQGLLKKDLEAVESGQGSTESVTTGDADYSSPDEFLARQRAFDEESERDQERRMEDVSSFTKFIRQQGVTDEELSDDIISGFLWNGDLGPFSSNSEEKPEDRKAKLETLHRQWEEKE